MKPNYVFDLKEFVDVAESTRDTKANTAAIITNIALRNPRAGFRIEQGEKEGGEEGGKEGVYDGNTPVNMLYLTDINLDMPFYYDRANHILIVNTEHKGFEIEDEQRRNVYFAEAARVTWRNNLK